MFSAVILKPKSQKRLIKAFESYAPEGWRYYAHHMTIVFNETLPIPEDLEKNVELTVTHIGFSLKAIAFKVSGYPSKNKIPHITLAVARDSKPYLSNMIEDWYSIEPVKVNGVVAETKDEFYIIKE